MSGIVGFMNKEKAPNSLLSDMIESLQYTERDHINKWSDDFVAIARVHHGVINPETQPIFNEHRSLCIFMDGEVFDYQSEKQSLIKKGHYFKLENNDAEYCLHLYEEMGEKAFEKLNGSFLMVLYDLSSHKLLIVNDRFSSHPLFYYVNGGSLLFGTQLHPLLKLDELPRRLDPQAVFEFFTFQRILGAKTYYRDIKVLPPSTVLRYQNKNISFVPYWRMKYKEEKQSERYYVDKLAEGLKKSVARRTQGNQRLGILLTGGLDSRTILAASDKEMVAFTYGNSEAPDVKIAKRIAKTKGCKHIFLKPSFDHFVNLLDKAVEIGDGMYCFHHAHVIGFFDQIQKECDILLHGNPPELFFRGTSLPRGKELKVLGKRISLPILCRLSDDTLEDTIFKKLKYNIYQKNPKQLFTEPYSSIFDTILANSVRSILAEANKKVTNIYDKFLYFDIYYTSRYPSFLFEMAIRDFMDERTILLFDNDLFDLHLKMPFKIRSNSKVWKKALVKLDPKIAAITDANTGCPLFIPQILEWGISVSQSAMRTIKRKLHSLLKLRHMETSWPNYPGMIRHNDKLKKLIQETIEDPECLDPSLFDIQKIKEIFRKHLSGKEDYMELLFLLLTFGRWHKKYGPHTKDYGGELN